MKTYNTEQIRNIALIGNTGSGKTLLSESLVFEGKIIERKGTIEAKNTISDYNEIEQLNGNSIFPSILYTEFEDKKINIIDTPGLDDFIGGVISSLYAADMAVMVINAQNGVEVGTEINARNIEKFKKPMMIAINHLDHDKANIEKTLEQIHQTFGSKAIQIQYPVNTGQGFSAIIDLLSKKMYRYNGGKAEILDIPDNEKSKADELYNQLIEKAAESEESLMEIFFDKGTLSEDELRRGLSIGIKSGNLYPIVCCAAKSHIGIDRLLQIISNITPSPLDVAKFENKDGKEIQIDPKGQPTLFVFKTTIEPHIGEINYFKVVSGEITESIDLVNQNTQTKERLSQLFVVLGKNRIKVPKLVAGDIGATVKLKNTKTNHTLTVQNAPIEFKPMTFPNPKYRTAIRPLNEGDEEKLGEALNRMRQEDPTIIIEYSKELKQIIISGQGEYHLNILKWHLDNVFKINTEFIPPRIPYRETITKVAQQDYRHKKQSGGAGQFGEVHLIIEPYYDGMPAPSAYKIDGKEYKVTVRGTEEHDLPWGGKLVYVNCIVGGAIDAKFHPAILKGIMEKMEEGPLTGSYARDIRVCVYDGKMHPVDSNEISFRLAGRNAFKEAFKKAGPKILEPIYDVEIWVPSDRMGDVMSDLQGRRAIVQGMSSEKGFEKITAKVPLAEMGKYSTALSSITGGRAMFSMKFAEYTQVPAEVQEKLLKEYKEESEE